MLIFLLTNRQRGFIYFSESLNRSQKYSNLVPNSPMADPSSSSSSQVLVIFQEDELPSGLLALLNAILLKSTTKVIDILNFSRHLLDALRRSEIDFVVASEQDRGGDDLKDIFMRIVDSRIAIVVFSSRYTESRLFLDALVKIRERVEEGKLVAIPIFYRVEPSNVIYSKGEFGNRFRALAKSNERKRNWKEALHSISNTMGFTVSSKSPESEIPNEIVKEVKRVLKTFPSSEGSPMVSAVDLSENIDNKTTGTKQQLDELIKKLDFRKIRRQQGIMLMGSLLLLFLVLQQIGYRRTKRLIDEGGAINRFVENLPKDEYNEFNTGDLRYELKQSLEELKERVDINKIRCQLVIAIGVLLFLFFFFVFVHQQIDDRNTRLTGAIYRYEVNVPKGTENPRDTYTQPKSSYGAKPKSYSSDAKTFGIKQRLNEMKEKLNLNKIGMIIGCLLLLFFVLQQFAYTSTRLIGAGVVINGIGENVPKVVSAEETEHRLDTSNEFHTGEYGAKPDISSLKAETNADFHDRTLTNSPMNGKVKPPQIQVFINFRGVQLRNNFVGHLVNALQRSEINVFIDDQEQRGKDLNTLFKTIEDSGIAIVVFSSRYTESKWCLEELVKINERVNQSLLEVLPIFYKVTPTNVKRLKGEFGDHFRDKEHRYEDDEPMIKRWKKAIYDVSHKFALTFDENSSVLEIYFIDTIVKEVLKMLQAISKVEKGQSSG